MWCGKGHGMTPGGRGQRAELSQMQGGASGPFKGTVGCSLAGNRDRTGGWQGGCRLPQAVLSWEGSQGSQDPRVHNGESSSKAEDSKPCWSPQKS